MSALRALLTIQEFHPATVKEPTVSQLRVNAFSLSVDGFGAGPDQSQDQPLATEAAMHVVVGR